MVFCSAVLAMTILGSAEHDEAARYFKMRAYAEAERRYSVLVAANPGDIAAALGVADAIAKQEDWERAAASYQLFVDAVRAQSKSVADKWARDVARAWNAIGVVASELGRWDDARAALERAVAADGAVGLYRANMAFAWMAGAGKENMYHRGTEEGESANTEGKRREERRAGAGAVVITGTSTTTKTDSGAGKDAGAGRVRNAERAIAVLKDVKPNDPVAALAAIWRRVAETPALRAAANWWKPDETKFRACRPRGEPKTAGLVYAMSTHFAADGAHRVTVCERAAFDVELIRNVAPAREIAVFASVQNWAEASERVRAMEKRAAELSR